MARYPSFCGEKADSEPNDLDQMCRQELAIFFTHIAHETGLGDSSNKEVPTWRQGMYYLTEVACTPEDLTKTTCNYQSTGTSATNWPSVEGE